MLSRRLYWNFRNFTNRTLKRLHNLFEDITFYIGLFVFLLIIYDVGFSHIVGYIYFASLYLLYLVSFTITSALRTIRYPPERRSVRRALWFLNFLLACFCVYKFSIIQISPDLNSLSYYGSLLLCFVLILLDTSRKVLAIYTLGFNPALAFALSFILLSFMGCGLLLLPRATVHGISFTDALFTSVSAVCVTGLTTLDTAMEFTRLGKFFILCLIQLGGLGILSFTSFLGYLYKGGFSLQNQLFLREYVTAERVSDTFRSLSQVIVITLLVEALGALGIFLTVDRTLFDTVGEQVRFSIFHSVSAFCNAGFSTTPNGLFNPALSTDYDFQLVICALVIVGGIGYPIVVDFYKYIRHYILQTFAWVVYGRSFYHLPRTVSANTSIVITTTVILLVVGFITFFITEYYGILYDHTTWEGKVATAFFGAVTPRTAGFNTFDLSLMQPATILIYLLLMWIGASPASTGGGVKTSTFALAVLNVLSLAKGKDRVEIRRREIANESVRRAFAIITLSLLVIGPAILIITVLEPEKLLINVAFECFSAFSTVGLTLGITPLLSDTAKLVLVVVMFIGRVGTFTLFVAFSRRALAKNYHYPKETIFIS
ncbi:TrkH family potassium uptake protein [Telluribacter sp. SYSU D00476]|uniref:TrkH family potassium uptake protein n=1 Tax=Telluribacter sp. SYSU D00476 TaxID=2811430 RepID=UPI001FF4AEE0|nr:potassium transporter TrkG [Telluribacter sp. SYSU D00476]